MPVQNPTARRNRAILLAAAVLSIIVGWFAATALSTPVARPDGLTRVLRGMVSIKGAILAGAVGLAFWRMGRAIDLRPTVGYIVSMALSGFGLGALWSLSFIGLSSGLFWSGLLVALWGVSWDREMLQGWNGAAEDEAPVDPVALGSSGRTGLGTPASNAPEQAPPNAA